MRGNSYVKQKKILFETWVFDIMKESNIEGQTTNHRNWNSLENMTEQNVVEYAAETKTKVGLILFLGSEESN